MAALGRVYGVDVEGIFDVAGREMALARALQPVRARYDVIILDCAPGLSLVGVNALIAADVFIVPVAPQYLAIQGLAALLASVDQMRVRLNARTRLLGLVLMMFDGSPPAKAARQHLRDLHGDQLFATEIVASRAFDEAAARSQTIFQLAGRSAAAQSFVDLAAEVAERLRYTSC